MTETIFTNGQRTCLPRVAKHCGQATDNERIRQNKGFTLIELVVVISLISIMLFFSIPRFQDAILTDGKRNISQWIMGKIQFLKNIAVRDQKLYILHISIDNDLMWITNESMSEEEIQTAVKNGYELPGDIKVLDVEYLGKGKISVGQADILFYKKGYSDKAMIHIEDDKYNKMSFLIEPFLSKVKLFEKYVGLNG